MRKLPALFCVLGCLAQPAFGTSNITNLGALSQPEFQVLSEDLGSALSYKPVTPAAPLGTRGYDMGIEVTQTSMAKSSHAWSKSTSSSITVTDLSIPKLHVATGLPFGIDIAAVYAKVPDTNISMFGGELRYNLLGSALTKPDVAIRGAFTRMKGVSQLDMNTKSLDISVSQGFATFIPYAGIGKVWVTSIPNVGPSLQDASFTQNKIFAGANLDLVFCNLAAEWDHTGPESSISLKLGFRF
jgi:hypothetical protein